MSTCIRYFRNPCDRDPPTKKFKNFKFFKNSLKILNVYFWGTSVYFWGTSVYFWGTGVYFWGTSVYFWDNRGFRGFWNFFFCCWGVFGLRGSGGPVGFSKISKTCSSHVRFTCANLKKTFMHVSFSYWGAWAHLTFFSALHF